MTIKTTMYMHTHEEEGYEHTDKLCFTCATRIAMNYGKTPFIVSHEFTETFVTCHCCGQRMDGDYQHRNN